jgi:hypothetical protein
MQHLAYALRPPSSSVRQRASHRVLIECLVRKPLGRSRRRFDFAEVMFCHEGQDTAHAFDGQTVCVRDDLHAIDVPACKPID